VVGGGTVVVGGGAVVVGGGTVVVGDSTSHGSVNAFRAKSVAPVCAGGTHAAIRRPNAAIPRAILTRTEAPHPCASSTRASHVKTSVAASEILRRSGSGAEHRGPCHPAHFRGGRAQSGGELVAVQGLGTTCSREFRGPDEIEHSLR
jgi:hypothetical protein